MASASADAGERIVIGAYTALLLLFAGNLYFGWRLLDGYEAPVYGLFLAMALLMLRFVPGPGDN